jgi:hypothetical protein
MRSDVDENTHNRKLNSNFMATDLPTGV